MISRGFFKSSIIYSFVGALPYASGIILLPWFTAYLTPRQFGINALYMALMYFIQIISSFGMDMSVGCFILITAMIRGNCVNSWVPPFISIAITGGVYFPFIFSGGFRLFNFVFNSSDFIELLPFGMFYHHIRDLQRDLQDLFEPADQPGTARPASSGSTSPISSSPSPPHWAYCIPFRIPCTDQPWAGLIPAVISASTCLFLTGKEYGLAWNTITCGRYSGTLTRW